MVKEKIENAKFLLEDESPEEKAWNIVFAYKWSPGDLFWHKASGSKVALLRSGDYIDHVRFERLRSRNMKVSFESQVDISYLESGMQIFEELKSADSFKGDKESRKINTRTKFLRWSAPYLWSGENMISLLEIASLFSRAFYELDEQAHHAFSDLPVSLQQRSLAYSSMVCSTALIIGHTDFKFLQDVFHTTLFCDLSLKSESYTYLFEEVLEKERLEPGGGIESLTNKNMEHKSNVLEMHPELSKFQAEELLKGIVKNQQLLNLINIHHETLDGKGFPSKLNVHELNDIEKIFLAVGKCLPQKVDLLKKYKKENLIFEFLTKKLEKGAILSRLKSQIITSYNLLDDDEDYLDVVGF